MVLETLPPTTTEEMSEELFARIGLTDKEKNDPEQEKKMKVDLRQRIISALETYDFPPNWILNDEYFDSTAETVFRIITNKMNELSEEPNAAELKYSPMEIIGKKITQIFLGIYLNKFETVDLEDFKGFIHHCCRWKNHNLAEYIPGIFYCLKGLEAYLVTKLPCTVYNVSNIQCVFDQLGSRMDLQGPGYVGLLALKHIFIGQVHRKSYKAQNEIIRAVIKIYPESRQWNLWLHNILHLQRRNSSKNGLLIPPGSEEIGLIIKAANSEPENPLVLTGLCDTLADVVKYRGADWYGKEDFGFGQVFHSSKDIANYLRRVARHILELDSDSVKTNISIGTIFSAVLPRKLCDLPFAKRCIERAVLFHPDSSKAHGRMGIFCLTVDEDVKAAGKYFEYSFQMDPRNFQTLIELLLTHITNYEENNHKINTLLERELVNTEWTERNRGSLYFVKGIYEFLRGNTDESLQNWLFAVENLNFPVDKFKRLGYYQVRYGWPEELISLDLVYSKLSANPEKLPLSARLTLHTILTRIGDEMAEERQRQKDRGTETRGPGGNFRGKPNGNYSRGVSRGVGFRGGFRGGPYGGKKTPAFRDHSSGCNRNGDNRSRDSA